MSVTVYKRRSQRCRPAAFRQRRAWPAGVAVLLMLAPLATRAQSAATGPAALREPTVTAEEDALLARAMTTAETNATQAIRLLAVPDPETRSPALDFAIGNTAFQEDLLADAATAYRRALDKLPAFRRAALNLGRVYLSQSRPDRAVTLLQQEVLRGPADADVLRLLGHALLDDEAPVAAESVYRQALPLGPRDLQTRLGLVKALSQQERYAETAALAREILRQHPENSELWALCAGAYLALGKPDAAARTIEVAHRLGRADANLLATQGDLLLNRRQPEDALRAYERARRTGTLSLERVLRAIEGFLMVADTRGARRTIAQARRMVEGMTDTASDASRLTLLRLRAELAQQEQRPEEARALCREILQHDPLDGDTMLILAELQQQTGQLEDAVMTCERAARVDGFQAGALTRQAQIEVRRGRYARAVQLLETAQTVEHRPHVARYLEQVRRLAER